MPADISTVPTLKITVETRGYNTEDTYVLEVGLASVKMEKSTLNRILKAIGDKEGVISVILRYYMLGPTSSYFWGMDKRIYTAISDTTLPVVEGFASIFNNTLPIYCSPFPEDRRHGSQGNFFDYIKKIDYPARIIANPPYTERVMLAATNACIKYIDETPGGECVMMYPKWEDAESYELLMNHPGIQHLSFNNGNYAIHDHHINSPIFTPMPLTIFILSNPKVPCTLQIAEIGSIMASIISTK